MNAESCSSAWYLDIFPSDGILAATAARSNVAVVIFMVGVGVHILAIVGLDSDVFAIIGVWFGADLIDKLCNTTTKRFMASGLQEGMIRACWLPSIVQ